MLIEVESLKELERGKVYAIQTTNELIGVVAKNMILFTKAFGIDFIVFDEKTHPIDAPEPIKESNNASDKSSTTAGCCNSFTSSRQAAQT